MTDKIPKASRIAKFPWLTALMVVGAIGLSYEAVTIGNHFNKQATDITDQIKQNAEKERDYERAQPADRFCMSMLSDDIKEKRPETVSLIKAILADGQFNKGECDDLMQLDSDLHDRDRKIEQTAKLKKLKEQFYANR